MKKRITLIIILLSSILLAACNASQGSTSSVATGTGTSGDSSTTLQNQDNSGSSTAFQLALGTLELEKTDYPVDSAQAAMLLPLWKAERSLSKSDTTAAEEMAGLLKQIRSSMTSEQLQAIQGMNLNIQELPALAQQLGLKIDSGTSSGNTAASSIVLGASQGGPPGGDMGGGGPPPGDAGGSGVMAPQANQTTNVQSSGTSTSTGLSSTLLDAIIQLLKGKVQ